MKITQLMVITDFSDNARLAYPTAAAIARKCNAELHLAHVVVPTAFQWKAHPDDDEMAQEVETLLQKELAEQPAFAGLKTQAAVVRHRWPQKGLEEYADRVGIQLIVSATHGWTSVKRFLLGSFAERLTRNARRPVLVARTAHGSPAPFAPQEVLVPYDGSPIAAAVLPVVKWLSEQYGCRFTFQYVYGYMQGNEPFMARILKLWEHETVHVERQFAEIRQRELADVDVRLETSQGVAYEEILRKAAEIPADLILLATHGLLGAVAQNVLRTADCSVMTVYAESADLD